VGELKRATGRMELKLLRVTRPKIQGDVYGYSFYQGERTNFLIPL